MCGGTTNDTSGRSVGSIPACAGEPRFLGGGPARLRVYPRVCGGTWDELDIRPTSSGLSPRVRGNLGPIGLVVAAIGSIPACAGEPLLCARSARRSRVYPRVCGGTFVSVASPPERMGLSPRVRGNLGPIGLVVAAIGSIPACAGEPGTRLIRWCLTRVYPRVCGGTASQLRRLAPVEGLSPRVRGNLDRQLLVRRDDGSIPACAGEPRHLIPDKLILGVYPRVCGGTTFSITIGLGDMGLSPRVRGNHSTRRVEPFARGSIPACAGEPGTQQARRG